MNSVLAVLCVCLLAGQGLAFQISTGSCPEKGNTVKNFQAAKYMGRWYEIERFPQIWELGGKCSTADYSLGDDGKVIVKNAMRSILGGELSQEGFAKVTSTNGDAELEVTFDVPIVGRRQANYWVMATDYDNYAVVYSCSNISFLKLESAWILGRKTTLSEEAKEKVEAAIEANKINRKAFRETKQDC